MSIRNPFRSLSLYWQLQLAGWGTCTAIGFLWRLLVFRDPLIALIWTLVNEPLGLGITCLMRAYYRRHPFQGDKVAAGLLRVVTITLVAATVDVTLGQGSLEWLGLGSSTWPFRERWLMRMIVYWLLFSGWSFLYFGIKAELANRRNREHAHRAESALLRAELNLLRSQLDPHFLFNSLNGIAAEIPLHPDRALNMTRELADYLRFSLDHRNHATVPFRAELDAMAAYLRIEQARFGDQLAISIDPSGVGADRPIPAFTLQPLVENAVKHALRTSEPPWTISLKVTAEPEALVITVRNSGKLQPAVEPDRPRIGLDLLRRRLALSYPGKHLLSLDQEGGFVRAVLTLQGVPCA